MRLDQRRLLRATEEGAGSAGDEGGAKGSAEDKTILGEESSGDGNDAGSKGESEGAADKNPGADDSAKEKGKKDGEKEADKKKADGEGEGEQDGGEKPGEFDVSKFEIPEGMEINEAWMDKFTSNEAIQTLTQTQAKSLIPMLGEFVGDVVGDVENQRMTAQNVQTKEWSDSLQKDEYVTERGMDKVSTLAKAARDEFFPEMTGLFDKTGLGAHPTMVVGMARIAEALSLIEGQLEGGGKASIEGGSGRAADRIFPNHAEGGKYATG